VTILNPDLFRDTIRSSDTDQRTLPIGKADAKSRPKFHRTAVRGVTISIGPCLLAFVQLRFASQPLVGNQFFEGGDPAEVIFTAVVRFIPLGGRS